MKGVTGRNPTRKISNISLREFPLEDMIPMQEHTQLMEIPGVWTTGVFLALVLDFLESLEIPGVSNPPPSC